VANSYFYQTATEEIKLGFEEYIAINPDSSHMSTIISNNDQRSLLSIHYVCDPVQNILHQQMGK
jgi:hypothetical protein